MVKPLWGLAIIFSIVALSAAIMYVLMPPAHSDEKVYMPLNQTRVPDPGQSVVYFRVSDSVTGKPVPSMWISCTPTTGANKNNVRVWSTNNTGIATVYSDQGILSYRVAYGSQIYRPLPGAVEVKPGVQYVDVKLLPVGGSK